MKLSLKHLVVLAIMSIAAVAVALAIGYDMELLSAVYMGFFVCIYGGFVAVWSCQLIWGCWGNHVSFETFKYNESQAVGITTFQIVFVFWPIEGDVWTQVASHGLRLAIAVCTIIAIWSTIGIFRVCLSDVIEQSRPEPARNTLASWFIRPNLMKDFAMSLLLLAILLGLYLIGYF